MSTVSLLRERTYNIRRKLKCDKGIIHHLGEFYQVSTTKGDNPKIRLLPVDLENFNKFWTKSGQKPVDSEWTLLLPLSSVTGRIEGGVEEWQFDLDELINRVEAAKIKT